MTAARVFDAQGAPVALGKELGRGGEGAVYDVQGRPDAVAKVYLKPPGPDRGEKIAAMAAMAENRLLKLAAWPTATLHGPSRAVVGFTMPKVAGHRPVFQLYGPKLRLQEFPRADWRFLIHAAANTARAFSVVHGAGLVVGDVNHGNLVVAQDATVTFIDCDSFQVARGGRIWRCEVGVGTHQPPEMQGLDSYKGIVRSPNHDNFGLAVLVFQLLCMARHPFAGRHLGTGEPPSIEEAIAQSRYAYSRDQARTRMAAPPGSLPVDALTPAVQDLFEAAFAPGAARGGRPDGDRWVSALQELAASLRQCSANQGHHHLSRLSRCPWCEIEAASGTPLFPVVFIGDETAGSGIAALWLEVTRLAEPPQMPPMPDPERMAARPSQEALEEGHLRRRARAMIIAAFAAAFVGIFTVVPAGQRALPLLAAAGAAIVAYYRPMSDAAGAARERLKVARAEWEGLRTAWHFQAPGATFSEVRRSLDGLKARYDGLPGERAQRLQTLWNQRQQRQLSEHLDRFQIAAAKIPGVGRAKIATLLSHGVATADDVDARAIVAIPGFGPATAEKLVFWRRSCEQQFRFDPQRGVSPADIAALERDMATRRKTIEQDVAAGLAQLKAIANAAAARARQLEGRVAELGPKLAQALADAKAIGVA